VYQSDFRVGFQKLNVLAVTINTETVLFNLQYTAAMVNRWHAVQVSVWRVNDERSQVCLKFSTNAIECGFINKDFCTHEIGPYVCPFAPLYDDVNAAI